MGIEYKFYKRQEVSCREEPPEGGLLYLEAENKAFVLNNTGLLVWKTITGEMDPREIAAAVHSRFEDVDFDTVLNDVSEYIDVLYNKGFLMLVEYE